VTIVVDASVALKWVLDEADSEAAVALLDETLVAPALWLIEAANALWRRSLRGELTEEQALARLLELLEAPVSTVAIEDDLVSAAHIANVLKHPVYDCLYLALALREGAEVVTADARFAAVVEQHPDFAGKVRRLTAG
jgi:predicted nucleic acid-binding protein